MIKVARTVVQTGVDLGVYGGVHDRMAVAGSGDGDASVAVEEPVAVDIFDHAPVATGDDEGIQARQRWARHTFVLFDDEAGLGAGQIGDDVGGGRG